MEAVLCNVSFSALHSKLGFPAWQLYGHPRIIPTQFSHLYHEEQTGICSHRVAMKITQGNICK